MKKHLHPKFGIYRDTVRGLRQVGLPENLFDEDFPQQLEVAKERAAYLRARIAEMEQSDRWKDVDLPWTRQSELPPGAVLADDWLCLVQGKKPAWGNNWKEWKKLVLKDGIFRHRKKEYRDRAATMTVPRTRGTNAYRAMVALGINPEEQARKNAIAAQGSDSITD